MFRARDGKDPSEIGQHDETCDGCHKIEAVCTCPEFKPVCTEAEYLDEDGRLLDDQCGECGLSRFLCGQQAGHEFSAIADELPEDFFDCGACCYNYTLAGEVIDATGDIAWLDRALAAFALEGSISDYSLPLDSITAIQLHDLSIVKSERAMREAQDRYEREQEAKRKG